MFKIMRSSENRIDVEFSGKLDSNDMRALFDELTQKSAGIEHGRMLYRIGDFAMPTLGAIGVELAHLPQVFRFVRRFDRMAIVVGKQWVRKASEIEGALIPGLQIKSFDLGQETQAEAWLHA
jgi:hypothetical protein